MHRWLNFLIVLFSLAPGSLLGQLLDINLQPYNRLTAFSYQAMGDEVAVMSNDSFPDVLLRLNTLERIEMENEGNGVRLIQDGKSLGVFPEVILWCNDPTPRFKISPTKAKGLPRRKVIVKHALRNAMIPIVTLVSLDIAFMIGGAIITESIFGWPGVGRLYINAIGTIDYPVVMAIVMVIGIGIVIMNIVADILYGVLDPRVRYE